MSDTPRSESSFRFSSKQQQKDMVNLAVQSSAKDSKSRSSFSVLPTHHKPQQGALRASDTVAQRKAEAAAGRKESAFNVLPKRHYGQPPEAPVSMPREQRDDKPEIRFWRNVCIALQSCHGKIEWFAEYYHQSRVGKEWMGIVQRRMQWIKEDETKLLARIDDNKSLRKPVDDSELRQVCRMQEDRLRRLPGVIEALADRLSGAEKASSEVLLACDRKVQQVLRDAYDNCAKARKNFVEDVDEAVVDEEEP